MSLPTCAAMDVHRGPVLYPHIVRKLVADMVELHDALRGAPAIWVGQDLGERRRMVCCLASADRCRGVVNLFVPYFARGVALPISFLSWIEVSTHCIGIQRDSGITDFIIASISLKLRRPSR